MMISVMHALNPGPWAQTYLKPNYHSTYCYFTILKQVSDSRNEVNVLKELSTVPEIAKFIPKLLNFSDTHIELECIVGITLKELLTDNNPSVADIAKIIKSIFNILVLVKSYFPDFKHNDLHCGNVLIKPGQDMDITIIDFDVSTISSQSQTQSQNQNVMPDDRLHILKNIQRYNNNKQIADYIDVLFKENINYLN
jgi:predicted Ser/Thr protein kinase